MKISEIMTKTVECIAPDATLQDAAALMQRLDCGCLPICDDYHLVGMITDRDISIRATAVGADPVTQRVRQYMSPGVTAAFEDQEVEEASRLMEEKQIRRLPIVSREGRLVGIVSLGDLAVQTHDQKLSGEVLEHVSEPCKGNHSEG